MFSGLLVLMFVIVGLFALYNEFVSHALLRLGLSPQMVSLALVGILVGGLINIPLHHSKRPQLQLAEWITFYQRWGEEPFPIGSDIHLSLS